MHCGKETPAVVEPSVRLEVGSGRLSRPRSSVDCSIGHLDGMVPRSLEFGVECSSRLRLGRASHLGWSPCHSGLLFNRQFDGSWGEGHMFAETDLRGIPVARFVLGYGRGFLFRK